MLELTSSPNLTGLSVLWYTPWGKETFVPLPHVESQLAQWGRSQNPRRAVGAEQWGIRFGVHKHRQIQPSNIPHFLLPPPAAQPHYQCTSSSSGWLLWWYVHVCARLLHALFLSLYCWTFCWQNANSIRRWAPLDWAPLVVSSMEDFELIIEIMAKHKRESCLWYGKPKPCRLALHLPISFK